jgi:hypothetical protein
VVVVFVTTFPNCISALNMTFLNYPPEDDCSDSESDGTFDSAEAAAAAAAAIERTNFLRAENLRLRNERERCDRQMAEEREQAARIKMELDRLEKDLQQRRNRR